jgi:large subunit ribosomal protein L3
MFEGTSTVDVTAVCKGRGFSGTVRRHNFSIGRKTHGNRNQRQPGSIGASADPSRVFPGQKMPGQYGNATVTMRNLQLVQVDKDNDVLLIKGSVPGKNKGVVYITKKKTENKPENK